MGWLPMDRLLSFLTWAVSLTPERLPAVIGITLSCGAQRMAWRDGPPLVKTFPQGTICKSVYSRQPE